MCLRIEKTNKKVTHVHQNTTAQTGKIDSSLPKQTGGKDTRSTLSMTLNRLCLSVFLLLIIITSLIYFSAVKRANGRPRDPRVWTNDATQVSVQ